VVFLNPISKDLPKESLEIDTQKPDMLGVMKVTLIIIMLMLASIVMAIPTSFKTVSLLQKKIRVSQQQKQKQSEVLSPNDETILENVKASIKPKVARDLRLDQSIEKFIGDREDIYHKKEIEEKVAQGYEEPEEKNPFTVTEEVEESLGDLEKIKGMPKDLALDKTVIALTTDKIAQSEAKELEESRWKSYQVTKDDEDAEKEKAEKAATKSPLCKDCRLLPEATAAEKRDEELRKALSKLAPLRPGWVDADMKPETDADAASASSTLASAPITASAIAEAKENQKSSSSSSSSDSKEEDAKAPVAAPVQQEGKEAGSSPSADVAQTPQGPV